MNGYLLGSPPGCELGYQYVSAPPYDGVVVGSMTLQEQLCPPQVLLEALAEGKPVILYPPGLQNAPGNRALAATLAARRRELKNWGVVFTDGAQRKLITAQVARQLRASGSMPGAGAVLTPLAKEILEGKS